MKAKFKSIILIGTSHISRESIKEVEETMQKEKPGFVALELDKQRFHAMISNKKKTMQLRDITRIGLKGYLFNLIGAWIEKKLGKLVNTAPGSEMKTAIRLAKKDGIKIALVDQDVSITLKKISKRITYREKLSFAVEIVKAFFSRPKIKFDISKVPPEKIIDKLTKDLKNKYPSIHSVLIEERDLFIANNLKRISQDYPDEKMVAIVGAGHMKGILRELKK